MKLGRIKFIMTRNININISSVHFSHSVVSNNLPPRGLQHARIPCPFPTPRVYSNSCPLSQWCHSNMSSPIVPFSHLQSFQHQGFFKWVSSSHEVAKYWSFSFSISPSNEPQNWSLLGWTGWISLQSKGLARVSSNTTVQKHQFFSTQLSF